MQHRWPRKAVPPATSGPLKTIQVGGTYYTLLGTAHVSAESANDVRQLIDSGHSMPSPLVCDARHHSMDNRDAMGEQDLFQVFKQGKAGMVAASLALGAFQQRIEQSVFSRGLRCVQPLKSAVRATCRYCGRPRCRHHFETHLSQRALVAALLAVFRADWQRAFSPGCSKEDIEKLKEGDMLRPPSASLPLIRSALHALNSRA